MATVTIPKNYTDSEDLIAISRSDYEEFLVLQRPTKKVKTFRPTARDLRVVARGRREFAAGRFVPVSEL